MGLNYQPDAPTTRLGRIGQFAILSLGLILPALLAGALILLFADDDGDSSEAANTPAPVTRREVVLVPFNKAEVTRTQHVYQGVVRLVIAGNGQAAGNAYSDAFYLYTDDAGNLLDEPLTEMFDLEIDGERAIIQLGLTDDPPPFAADHVYVVNYDVGPDTRRIAFRISDLNVDDNSGQFTINVLQLAE